MPLVSGLWGRTRTLTRVQSECAGKPRMHQEMIPGSPTNHYELGMTGLLALAYHIVGE